MREPLDRRRLHPPSTLGIHRWRCASQEGDSREVHVHDLLDVEHSWMLPGQHTTFANRSDP